MAKRAGIVTVTLNPALDKTARISEICPGSLHRLTDLRVDAGGKGINVSRVIQNLGGSSLACAFAGGMGGGMLAQCLAQSGIEAKFVKRSAEIRTNLKLIDAQGTLTEFNESGSPVDEEAWAALYNLLDDLAGPESIFALCGSLPAHAAQTVYRDLIHFLHARASKVLLDADSLAFKLAMEALPDYIKPNRFELLQYFNLPQDSPDECLPALCRRLLGQGVKLVALSLGAGGGLFFNREEAYFCPALAVPLASTVGAGDAMVAALLWACDQKKPFAEICRWAMASAAAAVSTSGTNPPAREAVERLLDKVRMEQI